MFSCNSCGEKCSRIDYLIHLTKCTKRREKHTDYMISSSEAEDDTDDDPDWRPQSDDHYEDMQFSNNSGFSPSSPLTLDQIQTAKYAESMLENDTNNSILPESLNTQDSTPDNQGKDHDIGSISVLQVHNESENKSADKSINVLTDECTTSISLHEKIKKIRLKIAAWNQKRKLATKLGRKSTARRITKNIKKYERVSTEIIQAEQPHNDENTLVDNNISVDLHQTPSSYTFDLESEKGEGKTKEEKIGRKANYCLFCKKLVKKFGEHLQSKHSDTKEGQLLLAVNCKNSKERRMAKIRITGPIRKKWNAIYNQDILDKKRQMPNNDSELILVKQRHGGKSVPSVMCKYCLGQYRRDKLSVHLKYCEAYSLHCKSQNAAQTNSGYSQSPKLHYLPNSPNIDGMPDQFKTEILQGIHLDAVMNVALSDPTIMKFAISFHKSRRESSCKNYVIREMRDLAKLLINAKDINPDIKMLKDCFNPLYFKTIIAAALQLAKYDEEKGVVGVPSIAYRLSQPLKIAATLVKNEIMTNLYEKGGDRKNVTMIDDFLQMVNSSWKTDLGRICSKSQKTARVSRIDKMALEDDIIKMAAYLQGLYRQLLIDLENKCRKHETFDMLVHVLVVHIMLLIRRRPVDFKHAKLQHYYNVDSHDDLIGMVKGLTEAEIEACRRFHLFYVPGKNLEIVPMVLTPLMKTALDALIKHRSNVSINCETLFVLSFEKNINPSESLKLMKKKVKLEKPTHFTGNGLRHQAATFSKLHSSHPQYQDYLASALGHTLAVHKKHYELPLGVLQKIMVCPILDKIMTGQKFDPSQKM